ncbi:MAG: hypothetical protein A4E44_01398 [Methanosaeta sp. PtaB.Bin018]|jgi:hypothetical protein|nr:MAG: hypothetical protein A4E44_01398 [Methanosaeta sp. PtaB.Bin018]OPY46655.1 MAG: hypothetical protein A4E46_00825 [Methanosaeta sp. PtaU1.Bin016]
MRLRLLPTIIYGDCRYLRFLPLEQIERTYEKIGDKLAKILWAGPLKMRWSACASA